MGGNSVLMSIFILFYASSDYKLFLYSNSIFFRYSTLRENEGFKNADADDVASNARLTSE
jgi:hypothetical protein